MVAVAAAIVLLAAFGFLPRAATLYSTLGLMLYMLLLPPVSAVRLFILSLPWVIALPLGDYDKFQNWRILILEVFIIALAYQWRNLVAAFKSGFKQVFGFLGLTLIDWTFFAFLGVSLSLLLFNNGFWTPGVKQVITYANLYGIFFTVRFILETTGGRQVIFKTAAWAGFTVVLLGFAQLAMYLATDYFFFWQYWANTIIPVVYGRDYAALSAVNNTWFSYVSNPPGLRMFSVMPGSQVFAMVCVLTLPYLFTIWRATSGRTKKIWLAAVLLTALAIVQTAVRASIVGSVLVFVLLLVVYKYKKLPREFLKKGFLPILFFWAVLLLSFLVPNANLLERSTTGANLGYESNAERLIIWKASLQSVARHPLAGVGIGNFALAFEEERPEDFGQIKEERDRFFGVPKRVLSAHNILLQVLVESGIIGLIFFVAFWMTIFKHIYFAIRRYLAGSDPNLSHYALWFGVALFWVLGQAMFDTVFLTDDEPLTFFWLGLALVLSRDYDSK